MAQDDWYRRTTWSERDQEEFLARLNRCRGGASKAQFLRIQAYHLAESGHNVEAASLLDRLFAEFPENMELAQGHLQKALCLVELRQYDAAVEEFRLSLQAERKFPNVRTECWLLFPWFIVDRQLAHLYGEALTVLREFKGDGAFAFPLEHYQYAVVRALIAQTNGDLALAREFAKTALQCAATSRSGFRYHPDIGLVNNNDSQMHQRILKLAIA